jgi:hypothetical protein
MRSRISVLFCGRHYETAKVHKNMRNNAAPNLIRHRSRRYYARAFAGGKEVWKSLNPSHFGVAQARLAEFPKEHRECRSDGNGQVSAKMTFGAVLKVRQQNLPDEVTIRPTTRRLLKNSIDTVWRRRAASRRVKSVCASPQEFNAPSDKNSSMN